MSFWLNYHHLFYFKTIAEEQSVSGAAAKLRLGQPTLSAQLKQFEESLGVPLFERRNKRLILTEQGKLALDYAKSIFNLGSEMMEVLQDRVVAQRPALSIGAIDGVPKQIVLQMAKAALRISPCRMTLLEGRPDELVRELAAHRIDVLLTNFIPLGADTKGFRRRVLARKPVGFYAAPSFRALRKGFPNSLSGHPFILPTHDSRLRYDLDHWRKLKNIDFDVLIESQDISVKKLMAINELGILPAATYSVTHQILAGELIEIGRTKEISEEFIMVTADRRIENPIAKKLMEKFNI